MFLKYLDDLEKDRETSAQFSGKPYKPIIESQYRWEYWAAPKGKDGKIDHHKAVSGDDLNDFVNGSLIPYLKKFETDAEDPNTIEYKIGEIFNELKNKMQSGYNLREVLNIIDTLRFRSKTEKHEMSHLYEDKIKWRLCMVKTENDLFEIIEKAKVKVNKMRKNKKQSIKDFLIECENESKKVINKR